MKKLIGVAAVIVILFVFKTYVLEKLDDTTYAENPRPPGVTTGPPTFGGNNYLGPQVTTLPPTFKDKDNNPEYSVPPVRKE